MNHNAFVHAICKLCKLYSVRSMSDGYRRFNSSTRHLKSFLTFFDKCLQCLPTHARQLAPWRCNLIEGTLPSIGTTWKDSWTGWEGGSSSLWRVFTMPTCHTCRLDMSFRLSSTSVVHLPVTLFRP